NPTAAMRLFSESNSRFLCEVPGNQTDAFEAALAGVPAAKLGAVTTQPGVVVTCGGERLIDSDITTLKQAWQSPLA
ncbi:MAG: hypothetical protein AAF589_07355, partial [Planctomycetota bacterium]